MQYWRLCVSAVTKRVTTVLVRLYNVFATVPCTVAVSKCGRMLSPRSVWARFKVQEVKSSGTNHGTSLCSLAPRCLFSCPQHWLACFLHVITPPFFTPHIHKILRLTACIYRILPRFDQPCCGIIFILMASRSPLPSHLLLAVG